MLSKLKLTNKALILADQAVVSGSALLTQLLIAGSIGMAGYGKYSAIVMIQLFLLSVQQAAITGMYQVICPAMNEESRDNYTSGVWTIELFALVALSVVAYIIHAFFSFGLTGLEFVAAVANGALFLLQDFFRRILLTRNETKKALIIDVINNGLQIALLSLFAMLHGLTFLSALFISALTFIPALVLSLIWLKPRAASRYVAHVFRHHGAEALWMTGSALVQWFSGNFYIVTAGVWLGPVILGVLRLGQYIFGLINVLLQAVENYVLPKAGQLSSQPLIAIAYLKKIQRKMLLFMGSGLAAIALLAKPALYLIKAEHMEELLTVTYGMCGIYVVVIISYPIRIALRSLKLSKVFFTGYVINSMFSFCTAYLFIHQWGILGVLAGLFFSQAILFIFWVAILQNKYSVIWK